MSVLNGVNFIHFDTVILNSVRRKKYEKQSRKIQRIVNKTEKNGFHQSHIVQKYSKPPINQRYLY